MAVTNERHVRINNDPEGGWIVTGSPTGAVESHTASREDAIDEARNSLAGLGGGVLYVHEADGSVQQQVPVE